MRDEADDDNETADGPKQKREFVEWELANDEDKDAVCNAYLVITLFQLNVGVGADQTIVDCYDDGSVTARKNLKARELTLVPVSHEVTTTVPKGRDYVTAFVSLPKSAESQRYINGPADLVSDYIRPYWLVRDHQNAADSGEKPNLDTFIVEVTGPNSLGIKDPIFKVACATAPIKMRIPVLSNPDRIQAGSLLVAQTRGRKRKGDAK